jgi:hypothetical protein
MARATAEAFAQPRSVRHGLDATTTLQDFALVTFDVDPERLTATLPEGLAPEIRTLDDGRRRGFVSAVSFRDVDFRFSFAEFVRASFFQTNYRAYVRGPDGLASVFFYGTTLDSRLVVLPRHAWQMPWHPGSTRIEATWSTDGICTDYRHRCTGAWGTADVRLTGSSEPMGRLDGFVDVDDAARVITHPLLGWFLRPDGSLGRYRVWHDRLRPHLGTATKARYSVFEDLGLVEPRATPHSVLLQRATEFDVFLPPTQG